MDELPRWVARLNVARPQTDYTDLLQLVSQHYRVYASAESFLGPYNARARNAKMYWPPSRDELKAAVKQHGMNDFSYLALISNLIKFCERTKGMRALPTPHPSTVHSIQVPEPAFTLRSNTTCSKMGTHELTLSGVEPVFLSGVRNPDQVKFVILRPKLSRLGTPSAKEWEVMLFNQNHGYIPNWTDSTLNTKWVGLN
jgi:hypothetical protein